MEVAVIGVNHKVCPIEIRECVAFTESKKIEALEFFKVTGIDESIILSTCNRSEIYICTYDNDILDQVGLIKDFYETYFNEKRIGKYLFVKKGQEALEHIFRVSAGLDSIVIGEDQILGQVKDAHTLAMEKGTSKKVLNKIFREAITMAKEIKNKTKISENPLSISHIAVKFLKEKQGTLENKKALVIGVGKMNQITIKYLQSEKVQDIYVTNRTHARAEALTDKYEGLMPIAYENRYDILREVDFVVTATASPHVILKKEHIKDITKPLYMMDIAMPRDVDPKVSEIENIHLYDIDDLKAISEANNAIRQRLTEEAEYMIRESLVSLKEWLRNLQVDPIIWGLNEKCAQIEANTLNQINKKLKISNEEMAVIEKYLGAALRKVVRTPIVKIRQMKSEEQLMYSDIVAQLFDIKIRKED